MCSNLRVFIIVITISITLEASLKLLIFLGKAIIQNLMKHFSFHFSTCNVQFIYKQNNMEFLSKKR
jgi:hypothetical protein